ncbi:MAG: FAD-dependent oxidoreductase, partial [Thiohalospira sp.]
MTRPVVVGGGWAGLAAAVELADAGLRPRLLEAGPRLGGRAATLPAGGSRADAPPLDHGQHLLIGAYTGVEALLKRLDIPLDDAFVRVRPGLRVAGTDGGTALAMDLAALPAPLHSLVGLLRARGLDRRQRLALPRLLGKRGPSPFPGPSPDETVAALFRRTRQPEAAIRRLWAPLCLATLNTPPEQASARLFTTVVKEVFQGPRRAADLWFPRRDLGALLAEPARAHIEARGGEVLTHHRVRRLLLKKGDGPLFVGVATREAVFHGPVVLAVAAWHAARLVRGSLEAAAGSSLEASEDSEWGFGEAGRVAGGRREYIPVGSQRPSMA